MTAMNRPKPTNSSNLVTILVVKTSPKPTESYHRCSVSMATNSATTMISTISAASAIRTGFPHFGNSGRGSGGRDLPSPEP